MRVFTSRMLQTNATILDGGWIVDAPYFPDEIDEVARLAPDHRIAATHGHYDHLLMLYARRPLHVTSATRDAAAAAPEQLAEFDAVNYVARPPLVLDLATTSELHWIPAPGHAADAHALLFERERVLCCADYLSDVEIPLLSETGDLGAYLQTLDRLEALIAEVETLVPGHGSPCGPREAARRLAADREYLQTQRIPPDRDTPRQREIHAGNVRDHF